MGRIKNILFDLDDTIYDFGAAEEHALAKLLRDIGVEPTEERMQLYSGINLSYWKRLELGEVSRAQVKVGRFETFFQEIHVEFSAERADEIYRMYLSQGHFFMPGAEEMLQDLWRDYRLFLVTNGTTTVQKGRIASGQIEKYFEKIFISEMIGHNKPSTEFFTYCFSQMGEFSKDETIIIGDSLTSDIKGGINAGITTMWFNVRGERNQTDISPDYEIHKLSEVKELLQRIE